MRLNKVKIKYSCAWNPMSNIDYTGKSVEPQKVHSHSFFYDGQELIEIALSYGG